MATATTEIVDRSNRAPALPVFFRHYVPKQPLSEFVGLFWYRRGHDVPCSKERILPMGTVELVINLGSGRSSESGISGPHSRSFIIERTFRDQLLGVHFKLGGAFPFLGFPFGDLHNLGITLDDLWGERRAGQLLCLLHDAKTVEMKFHLTNLVNFLRHQADPVRLGGTIVPSLA